MYSIMGYVFTHLLGIMSSHSPGSALIDQDGVYSLAERPGRTDIFRNFSRCLASPHSESTLHRWRCLSVSTAPFSLTSLTGVCLWLLQATNILVCSSLLRADFDLASSSDFLSNLLVLLLRILNSGLSDSGLLVHLSEATAGSLNGVGHSTIYEELGTYSSVFSSSTSYGTVRKGLTSTFHSLLYTPRLHITSTS